MTKHEVMSQFQELCINHLMRRETCRDIFQDKFLTDVSALVAIEAESGRKDNGTLMKCISLACVSPEEKVIVEVIKKIPEIEEMVAALKASAIAREFHSDLASLAALN